MGLDISHNAFKGKYSDFNRLRQSVAWAIGGSYPPHWHRDSSGALIRDIRGMLEIDGSLNNDMWYGPAGHNIRESHPGLFIFLSHSDCDGELSPQECIAVANELEAILPQIDALPISAVGRRILEQGGAGAVLRKFIAGCRTAAMNNEPLLFR